MSHLVAIGTQSDEVFQRVAAELASRLRMMNLQVLEDSTLLASPTISLQDQVAHRRILVWTEFDSGPPLPPLHY